LLVELLAVRFLYLSKVESLSFIIMSEIFNCNSLLNLSFDSDLFSAFDSLELLVSFVSVFRFENDARS